MTPKQALSEIINSSKHNGLWYKYPTVANGTVKHDEQMQTYLRVTALRILNGTAKAETMKKFFGIMGYELNVEYTVTKK